ncbi:MAG: hypothetical protein KBB37_05235 [Bacteroidia bacterium]|nr:hypothetical protein [Bacteroidia bacterium]MBP7260671.1 hypothetical protein [Bacteroidia bacterium]MBP9181148.1 hypothetical protein [Bacteroidia bacterium]MBP9725391.1 hypothetical protein [Bacteroidia bacterium]
MFFIVIILIVENNSWVVIFKIIYSGLIRKQSSGKENGQGGYSPSLLPTYFPRSSILMQGIYPATTILFRIPAAIFITNFKTSESLKIKSPPNRVGFSVE